MVALVQEQCDEIIDILGKENVVDYNMGLGYFDIDRSDIYGNVLRKLLEAGYVVSRISQGHHFDAPLTVWFSVIEQEEREIITKVNVLTFE